MHRHFVLALAASASAIALAAPAAAQTATAQTDATGVASVQELVVTAEKRNERLRDVPLSVTALPGAMLDKLQDRSFADYAALVPGLALTPTQPGSARLTLRGLNTGGVASTVSVYVDESPFGSSSGLVDASQYAADFDTFDVQRIEVLRGPQGTLYGANSEGGLIKFVTNAPDPSALAGALEVGGQDVSHGQTTGSVDGMANIPIGPKAAFRISGFYQDLPGWVSDPLTGQKDVNRGSKWGGRASFLLRPSDNFSIRLTASAQDIRNRGTPEVDVDPVTLAPIHGDLAQERFINEPSRYAYQNYDAAVNWNFGWANLLSVTSWGKIDTLARTDETALLGPLLSAVFGMPLGAYLDQRVNDDKFTQEVRLTSPAGRRLEWQLGGFYTHERGLIDQAIPAFDLPSGAPSGLPAIETASIASTYEEIAGFASADYHFTPTVDVQVGGRYSHNNQSGTETTGGLLLPAATFSTPSSENVFNYSVAPRWHITPSTLLYARVANGYRPGGPNVLPPNAPPGTPRTYTKDTTVSYEAGVKSSLFDGRLTVDVAAFLTEWNNVQLLEIVNNFAVNGNGGKARSDGVEWDATLVPVRGLTLNLSGAYTDAKLTSDAPAVGGVSGDRLPWIPKLSTTLDGEYDFKAFGETTAFVGATYSYVGGRRSDFSPSGIVTAPSYETVGVRAGLDYRRWRLDLYLKNFADRRGIVNLGGAGGVPGGGRGAVIIQPRTAGVALSARF
ncbi:MAG: TonB-dependent receptor [Caulobacteraceae bacterium]